MITVTNPDDDDAIYSLDCDTGITLADLKALLEADSSIPVSRQALYFNAAPLADDNKTLTSLGIKDGDLMLIRDTAAQQGPSGGQSGTGAQQPRSESEAAEQLRQQILSDPNLMGQISHSNPALAEAARSSPSEFVRLLSEFRSQMSNVAAERQRAEAELASSDMFDVEAQRRIEEAIQQENIAENLEHAMEYTPESFGRVHMLYVRTEVNGHEVKAFVDSGAQSTIMSPECAQRCGIMRLLDKRFAGVARGVGTAKILGRVHSAQIKLADNLFLPCSFTIMESKGVECLFGLDMLKRYQACIDLTANALVVNGVQCRFLDEHELPAGHDGDDGESAPGAEGGEASARSGADAASAAAAGGAGGQSASSSSGGSTFPGSGQSLGATTAGGAIAASSTPSNPSTAPTAGRPAAPSSNAQQSDSISMPPPSSRPSRTFPAASMKALQDLGATEVQARALLEASGGNVEVAAGLLFHGQ